MYLRGRVKLVRIVGETDVQSTLITVREPFISCHKMEFHIAIIVLIHMQDDIYIYIMYNHTRKAVQS